jgi:hypothetical protein
MNRIRLATAGLLVAWMAHDLEELATMSDSSRTLMRQLPDWMPAPASIRQGFTARYLATGIPGNRDGRRRGHHPRLPHPERSAFYQNALFGFGLHGLGPIAMSLLARGYTSGVATALGAVVAFWLWATRALQQAAVPNRRSLPAAIAFVAGSRLRRSRRLPPHQQPALNHRPSEVSP